MDIGDVLAIEHDSAATDGFETADGAKERTLSASRGSDKDDEFLFLNLKIDVLQSVKGVVILLDLSQFQVSHWVKPLKIIFFPGGIQQRWVAPQENDSIFRTFRERMLAFFTLLHAAGARAARSGVGCPMKMEPPRVAFANSQVLKRKK